MITAAVGYLFLINRRTHGRRVGNTSACYTTQRPDDLQQDVTYADVTILKRGKVNRSTLPSGDIEYAAVCFSGRSGSTSLQASTNQLALDVHTPEEETVYAQRESSVREGKERLCLSLPLFTSKRLCAA
ncbi:hypothetical protein DPX16_1781 [Anabarilius grahami]|uniref:Uncharacterized protein n=1 Tax=Anabarilius grahami TaxID=495550 RepID=A0A3N0YEJ9_ANAGA|nr:hypothetical protein DPX16_1781 [Anabarilius grahami]